MNMYEIRAQLEKEICLPDNLRYFKEAQKRFWELYAFDSPVDIVKIFKDQNPELVDVKAYLLRIMLTDYQANPHQLWSGLLILCFVPWLSNCAKRAIENSDLEPEELTMLVVESFLEAATNMKIDKDRICILTMLMNTQRKVVQYIEKERERRNVENMAQVVDWKKAKMMGLNPEEIMMFSQLNLDDEQLSRVSSEEDKELLNLLFDIVMNNDTIVDYVRRKYSGEEKGKIMKHYHRLSKKVRRLRKKINLDVQFSR